jgi:hypothetical protein
MPQFAFCKHTALIFNQIKTPQKNMRRLSHVPAAHNDTVHKHKWRPLLFVSFIIFSSSSPPAISGSFNEKGAFYIRLIAAEFANHRSKWRAL